MKAVVLAVAVVCLVLASATLTGQFLGAAGEKITGSPVTENLTNLNAQQNDEDVAVFRLGNYKKYFYEHLPLVVTLWLLGMLVFALKFLGGLAYTQRLKYYRVLPVSEQWQQTFQRLKNSLNLLAISLFPVISAIF